MLIRTTCFSKRSVQGVKKCISLVGVWNVTRSETKPNNNVKHKNTVIALKALRMVLHFVLF